VNKLSLIIAAMAANTVAAATILPEQGSIEDDWDGAISVVGQTLPFSVHIVTGDAGLGATIDIQGATDIPLQNVSFEDAKLHLELQAGAGLAVFDGEYAGDSIGGTFTQAGIAGTFFLKRAQDGPAAPSATEEPVPYAQEEVSFHNADITLAGTLTVPESGGPHPAAVMITGSGAQTRDEELFGFRPFYMIADHLTRNGVAVLRYDDRGVGGSTGSVSASTSDDFAGDVLAAVELLKQRIDIDSQKIGLIGHSEGGIVAPLAASKSGDVAFMVLMAGTSVTGEEVVLEQGALIARASGTPEDEIARSAEYQKRTFAAVRSGEGWDELIAEFESQLRATVAAMSDSARAAITDVDAYVNAQVQGQMTAARTPWFRYFLDYDPAVTLRAVDTPVLALFGELDLQVIPSQNLGPMEEAFRAGNHPDYTIETLPRANHLFITATTGSPTEYATLPKEFVPEFLPLMTDWILRRVAR
jgi:pimeloyl-ACP methyl ester carboxylesterase